LLERWEKKEEVAPDTANLLEKDLPNKKIQKNV
jgi:hypothetical protein